MTHNNNIIDPNRENGGDCHIITPLIPELIHYNEMLVHSLRLH